MLQEQCEFLQSVKEVWRLSDLNLEIVVTELLGFMQDWKSYLLGWAGKPREQLEVSVICKKKKCTKPQSQPRRGHFD